MKLLICWSEFWLFDLTFDLLILLLIKEINLCSCAVDSYHSSPNWILILAHLKHEFGTTSVTSCLLQIFNVIYFYPHYLYHYHCIVSFILSSVLLIFPLTVLGRLATNSIFLGYLYGAVMFFTWDCSFSIRSFSFLSSPITSLYFSESTIKAFTTWPLSTSGLKYEHEKL